MTRSACGSGPPAARILARRLTLEPLDGSPAITTPIVFTPSGNLGSPAISSSRGAANYSAAWLNPSINGLIGDAQIGVMQVTLPANCPPSAARKLSG